MGPFWSHLGCASPCGRPSFGERWCAEARSGTPRSLLAPGSTGLRGGPGVWARARLGTRD